MIYKILNVAIDACQSVQSHQTIISCHQMAPQDTVISNLWMRKNVLKVGSHTSAWRVCCCVQSTITSKQKRKNVCKNIYSSIRPLSRTVSPALRVVESAEACPSCALAKVGYMLDRSAVSLADWFVVDQYYPSCTASCVNEMRRPSKWPVGLYKGV